MTTTIDISNGATVQFAGACYVITNAAIGFHEIEGRETSTGEYRRLPISELRVPDDEVTGVVVSDLAALDDDKLIEARRRKTAIDKLLAMPKSTVSDVRSCALELGVGMSTLYKWISNYRNDGRLTSLLPPSRNGGRGRSRLNPEVDRIITVGIEEHHLKNNQPTAASTVREVLRLCRAAGVPLPHGNTIRKRIDAIPREKRMRRRGNSKGATAQFGEKAGRYEGAVQPLSVVQIDHTRLDVVLVDEDQRLPLLRPWITLVFDVYSRMVLGFYVSFDDPGAHGTGAAIARAVLPKESWLAQMGLQASWPCWGFPQTIHVDNAREFRGEMLRLACEQYGISLAFRPVAKPEMGGHIERMMGTLGREIHELPGVALKPTVRGDYDPVERSGMTLAELELQITEFITGVYHNRVHSGIGCAPIKKWRDAILGTENHIGLGQFPRPSDEDRLRLDFMPFEKRTIQGYGVQIDEIRYYADVLRNYIGSDERFLFRRDPRDISRIYFWDPNQSAYFTIPYRNISHASISIWELREIKKRLKDEGRDVDEDAIFSTYDRLRQNRERAEAETKRVRRLREREKTLARNPKPVANESAPPAPQEVSPPNNVIQFTPARFGYIKPLEIDSEEL